LGLTFNVESLKLVPTAASWLRQGWFHGRTL